MPERHGHLMNQPRLLHACVMGFDSCSYAVEHPQHFRRARAVARQRTVILDSTKKSTPCCAPTSLPVVSRVMHANLGIPISLDKI